MPELAEKLLPVAPPIAPRFERNARLLGVEATDALARAHVVVFGLGGVGSWAAEGLARAGVGRLTLVDFDRVCATNLNRQLQATEQTIGTFKALALAERLRGISPEARIEGVPEFYQPETAERLLPASGVSFVVDAIDNVTAKLHLLARCVEHALPVVSVMGAGGRLDPTRVRVTDLFETHTDQFAKDVRKFLRVNHGIPATTQPTGILAVWSTERVREPAPGFDPHADFDAPPSAPPAGGERRKQINGTAGFVTSVFGMVAAGVVVRGITGVEAL